MPARKRRKPRCIIIAGPNGAGKTTFAKKYLPNIAGLVHFINADLIAGGISPLQPGLAAVTAGRLVLTELDRLAADRAEFAVETTLSGLGYVKRISEWKRNGYSVEIAYLRITSTRLALSRVAARVRQGGTMFPWQMSLGDSGEGVRISSTSTNPWQMNGLCMRIQEPNRSYP